MSKVTPRFRGKVENGKLTIDDYDGYSSWLYGLDGKEVSIVVDTWKKNRSDNENRYYRGVAIKLISEHTGYSDDEVHELLKSMFLKDHLIIEAKNGKERHTIVKSTTRLTTVESCITSE